MRSYDPLLNSPPETESGQQLEMDPPLVEPSDEIVSMANTLIAAL